MGHSHSEPHVTPLKVYFGIFGSLICLTFVTVGVSYLGLPPSLSIIVAMAAATVKATLVSLWFMHMLHDTKFNISLFLASIWFIGIFFVFTTLDMASRDKVLKSSDTFEYRKDYAAEVAK
jgi:cytochrome c oxidase subunit 4